MKFFYNLMDNLKTTLMTLIFCISISFSNAQLTAWRYKDAIKIQENSGSQKINYQVLLTINTQALVSMGRMQSNGYDIRFAKDCGGSILYPYWIETGMNTANTKIWVLVDTLNASGSRTINMYYGNNAATGTTSFDSTFTPASRLVVTAGSVTLTGTNNYSWFEIQTGASVIVTPNSPLIINARKIKITGTFNGDGDGYLGGQQSVNGGGPGGGKAGAAVTPANTSGGGGAYGGNGGRGNVAAVTNGDGGIAYGNTTTIDLGSGGGGPVGVGVGATEGNGGAGVTLTAREIVITGQVNINGVVGTSGANVGWSGGGGAGGGLLTKAYQTLITGSINAKGANGGSGNAGGGGGGGGRINLFSETVFTPGTYTVAAGMAGTTLNVNNPAAVNGSPGVILTGTYSALEPTVTILPHVVLTAVNNPSCAGSNVTFTATTGYSTYNFYKNNVSVQNSTSNTFSSTSLTNGNNIKVVAFYPTTGCSDTSNIITMTINPLPVVTVTPASPAYCAGGSTTLTANGAVSFAWSPATGLSATTGASVTANPTATSTYTVTGTSASGCTNTSTVTVTINPNPIVNLGPNLNLCSTAQTTLNAGNFTTYSWSDGSSASTLVVDGTVVGPGSHTYYVIVTNANNCTGSDTVVVNVSVCTGINEAANNMGVNIYPNPSNGTFNISISNALGNKLKLEIMSIEGQVVYTKENIKTTSEQIDISDLAKGIYFLKVSDQDQVTVKKIVLE